MRARETALAVLALALCLAPVAAAQTEEDPSVNESDFDTSSPSGDDAYLNESSETNTSEEPDPTLNESEMDVSAPTGDDAYLAESEAEASGNPSTDAAAPDGSDPSLAESDFDTSAPADDDAYLDDAEAGIAPAAGGAAEKAANTPGAGAAVLLGVLGAAALAMRRE